MRVYSTIKAGSGNNTTIEDWTTGDDINISDNYNQNNTNTSDNLIRCYNKNAANDTLKSVFSTSEKQVKPNSSSLFSILRDFLGQNNDENNNSIIYTNIE